MTWYTWPEHWFPRDFSMRIIPNTREFEGAYTPSVDVVDLLGERWAVTMSLTPEEDPVEVAAREAFFDRLKGRSHGITLSHLRLPVPQGTLRGAPTLSASAAQLANTMQIAGATAGRNLLRSPQSFGSAPWSNAWGGSSSITPNSGVDPGGTTQADFFQSLSGSSAVAQAVAVSLGVRYTFSIWAAARVAVEPSATNIGLQIRDGVGGAAAVLFSSVLALPAPVTWYRGSATWTSDRNGVVHVGPVLGSPSTAGVFLWGAQFEPGDVATTFAGIPTLRAGDMLGVNGQLVRVMEDVALDDAGAGTVEFQPRVRASAGWASGSAVAWARPTANFLLRNRDGVPNVWMPGYAEGPQIDLIEAW